MDDLSGFYCPRCGLGRCQHTKATYVRLYRGMLITVPDSAVYLCDYCGYQEFERDVIQHLQALIGEDNPPIGDAPRPLKTPPQESLDGNEPRRPKP